MRIGKEGYDVPDHNPEEEKQIKLQDEVAEDWENCDNKKGVLEGYSFPEDNAEEIYEKLTWEQKLEIYLQRNPEKNMSPEDYPH